MALVIDARGATHPAAPGSVTLGAVFAVLSVACYDTGYLLEKHALGTMPLLHRPSLQVVAVVLRSRRWIAGFAIMLAGLILQVGALMLAPVAVVQPILAGGAVALVVMARVVLGERLEMREAAAVALLALGVVAVAVSSAATVDLGTTGDTTALVPMVGGAGLVLAWSVTRPTRRPGAAGSAVAIGLCYGTGALGEKGVANELARHGIVRGARAALGSPYPWLFVVATAAGLVLFQVGLQRYRASVLVPASNGVSAAYALVGAILVFAEPWSLTGWRAGARIAAYASIVTGLVLLTSIAETATTAETDGAAIVTPGQP